MRTIPDMYILNLAISDIIYLTIFFFMNLQNSVMLLDRDIACTYFSFGYHMSVGLTTCSIAVLSFQRYRVTVNSLHVLVSSQPTWRSTGSKICGMWIVAALFAIPAARTHYGCSFSEFLWITNSYQRVAIFHLLVFCVLPLCVIAFSYIMMSRHLSKSRFSLPQGTQNAERKKRKNTAKVVLGLTVVFLFSYLPCHISEMCLYSIINFENVDDKTFHEFLGDFYLNEILSILDILLSINSFLNPVALFCMSSAFRRHFKRYLICSCKAKSPTNEFELTRRN
jgi:cytochrome b561